MGAFSASLGPDDDPLELTNADLAALLRNDGTTILGPVRVTEDMDVTARLQSSSRTLHFGADVANTFMAEEAEATAHVRVVSVPETYTLSVGVSGDGNVTPSGGTYVAGEEVMLTATPASGWRFDAWSGDLSGSANPTTIQVTRNLSVQAVFVENTAAPTNRILLPIIQR